MKKRMRDIIFAFLMAVALITGCSAVPPSSATTPAVSSDQPAAADGTAPSSKTMSVHFIDVGQGDSILVLADGQAMLIDAGEADQSGVVTEYLKVQGVDKLEYVIGTHPHSDHIGGMAQVLAEFPVDKLIMPRKEHTTRTFEELLDAIRVCGLKITAPKVGDAYRLGGASFTILSPGRDYGDELNDWSVGIRLTYGSNSFVMAGDAQADAEHAICSGFPKLTSDVLKLGHHGSSTSTSEEFLNAVSPSWAVISCGRGNSYGHPHKETMERLESLQIAAFRTDEQGTVIAESDGKRITWKTAGKQPAEDETQTTEAAAEPGPEPAKTVNGDSGRRDYVLNQNTMVFHKPDCSSTDRMKAENRKDVTARSEDLIRQGYSPCGICHP